MVHLKECGLPFYACATGIYEEFKFKTRNLEIINGHDASDADAPLFLCYTSHIVHEPLQVPVETWNEFDFIGTSAVGDFQNRECSNGPLGLWLLPALTLDRCCEQTGSPTTPVRL